jgi:hypothetical protein
MSPEEANRANWLADNAMRLHGLDPVRDEHRRPPYFERACEIVTTKPLTIFDAEFSRAFEDLMAK